MTSEVVSKRTVLLVEDDEGFRKPMRNALEMLGFQVREAANGLVGKTIFELNSGGFDLVISDIRMPEMDGVTFLKYVRASDSAVKFILMTGFSEVLEARQAYDLGANEFLTKPFDLTALKAAIKACFDPSPAKDSVADTVGSETKYCRIPVEEFITSSKLAVDLYLRLGESKYIKLANAGDMIPVDRLKIYKEKKVDYFYVLPGDLRTLVGLNLKVSAAASEVGTIKIETRLILLSSTAQLISQSFFLSTIDKSSLSDASQVVNNALTIASEDSSLMALLQHLQSAGHQMYGHSVAISVYSCLMAKKLGLVSQTIQVRLALGGILHDIGKKELPLNVLSKKRIEMTAEEYQIYESHPQRGKDILAEVVGVPEDVLQIVAHHHENNVGTGFPYGLPAARIHPLAKIVGVADCFFHMMLKMNVQDHGGIAAALNRMATIHQQEFDSQIVSALADVLQVKRE